MKILTKKEYSAISGSSKISHSTMYMVGDIIVLNISSGSKVDFAGYTFFPAPKADMNQSGIYNGYQIVFNHDTGNTTYVLTPVSKY